jgi:hypothetical protein
MSEEKRRRATKPGAARYLFGLAALGAWGAGAVGLAHVGGVLGGAIAGVLFTVPLCSLGEWIVHGVLYHGRVPGLAKVRAIHHQAHHFALFPPDRYVQHGKYEFMRFRAPLAPFRMADNAFDNALTAWSQIALHFVAGIPLILLPAWYATTASASGVAFRWSCLVTLSIISWLLAYVHGVIHTPRDRWIEHTRAFQWLDRHHYVHHVDLAANMNFMLPICDFLFGTQKWAMTDKEAARFPSFEQAKPMAKDVQSDEPKAVAAE